ncbi:MAG TPA: hypothetical protein VFQ62_00530 [Methylomirabilota bacterium]|jgi:hypothetical protein|nr:hypothetical protein [Methylomirabilota bacterium]
MHVDRWTKVVLSVIAIALVALAAHAWLERLTPTRAEAQTATPKYEVSLPKSWGKIVNFSNGNFLMESSDGTMRIVDLEGKPPEYPKVKVQIRWQ